MTATLQPYTPGVDWTRGLGFAVVAHWLRAARELAAQPPGSPLRWRRHDGRIVYCRDAAELEFERQADLVTFQRRLQEDCEA